MKCHIYEPDMMDHIFRRQELRKEDVMSINLYAYGQARKSSSHKERLFSVKMDCQFLPVAARMNLIDKTKPSNCPCCGQRGEDIIHMLYCQSPHIAKKRSESIDKLENGWITFIQTRRLHESSLAPHVKGMIPKFKSRLRHLI